MNRWSQRVPNATKDFLNNTLFVNNRKQADSAPLMTRAMREVRQESEMYKYDKVLININNL